MLIKRAPLLSTLVVAVVVLASCSDAEPSAQSVVSPTVVATSVATPDTTSTTSSAPSTTPEPVEPLPFAVDEPPSEQLLWDDVQSVSFSMTVNDEADGPTSIVGNFTAGEGLVVVAPDFYEGDVLAVVRDGEIHRAHRVGNEVFIDGPLEAGGALGWSFFPEMMAELLEPLATGQLPRGTNVYVNDSDVPDVVYSLPAGESEGVIFLASQPQVRVFDDAPEGGYPVPQPQTTLTREEVGRSGNPVLIDWYLDQAG